MYSSNNFNDNNHNNCNSEHGGVIVLFTLSLVCFLMMVAFAINIYLLATAKLEQQDVAEYVALGSLKSLLEPNGGVIVIVPGEDPEVTQYNQALAMGEYSGYASIVTADWQLITPGDLRIELDPDDGDCSDSDGDGYPDNYDPDGDEDGWCGFQPVVPPSPRKVINVRFGIWTSESPGYAAFFRPALPGEINAVNAVEITLPVQDPHIAPLLLPMLSLFDGVHSPFFYSRVIAAKETIYYQIVE